MIDGRGRAGVHVCRAELFGVQGAQPAGQLAAPKRGEQPVAAGVAPGLADQRSPRPLQNERHGRGERPIFLLFHVAVRFCLLYRVRGIIVGSPDRVGSEIMRGDVL